jgi:hypothetical protein
MKKYTVAVYVSGITIRKLARSAHCVSVMWKQQQKESRRDEDVRGLVTAM